VQQYLYIEPLTEEAFAPYGSMLGRPYGHDTPAYSNPATDFWHQHHFNAGQDGTPEVLWVNYRKNDRLINTLEVHWLTEQAIIPLGDQEIIHVVAICDASGTRPDLATLKAFRVPPGRGVCMKPGCWHATQVLSNEVNCVMLTRGSTTLELVTHLQDQAPARETALFTLPQAKILQITSPIAPSLSAKQSQRT